jgi:hypothetical protein
MLTIGHDSCAHNQYLLFNGLFVEVIAPRNVR